MNPNTLVERYVFHLEEYNKISTQLKPTSLNVRNGIKSSVKASKTRVGRRGKDDFEEANFTE